MFSFGGQNDAANYVKGRGYRHCNFMEFYIVDSQQLKFIADNPNLSGAVMARFLGYTKATIGRNREKPLWAHRGHGIPFATENIVSDGVYLVLKYRDRKIANGKLAYILENLDRLIYCLENNNGKLPPSLEEWTLKDLEFVYDRQN